MDLVKISVVPGDVLDTPCSTMFLKHIPGVPLSEPEMAFNEKLGGKLRSLFQAREHENYISYQTGGEFPFLELFIINIHDLPFNYSSLDDYARRVVRNAIKNHSTSAATAIHGPGAGLDASQSMEILLSGFHRAFRLRDGKFGDLREIILVENDEKVFNLLKKRIDILLGKKKYIVSIGKDIFLNPEIDRGAVDSDEERKKKLERYVFVARPYDKKFHNLYNFGIRYPVEKRGFICEGDEREYFTGEIVARIKKRIRGAEFVIADITGNNPNVFYEVGYAHGKGKKIILLSQDEVIPFDIRTENQIRYDRDLLDSLAKQLGEALDYILQNKK